jgi:hypothetical protein
MEAQRFLSYLAGNLPDVLRAYTIYDHPRDCPEKFVVRQFLIGVSAAEVEPVPGPLVAVSDTLHEAREAIPPGLVCFPRQEGDDPKIVETWL